MKASPCYNCLERLSECHRSCQKYSEWKVAFEKRRAVINENKRQERECREHQWNAIATIKKLRNERKK